MQPQMQPHMQPHMQAMQLQPLQPPMQQPQQYTATAVPQQTGGDGVDAFSKGIGGGSTIVGEKKTAWCLVVGAIFVLLLGGLCLGLGADASEIAGNMNPATDFEELPNGCTVFAVTYAVEDTEEGVCERRKSNCSGDDKKCCNDWVTRDYCHWEYRHHFMAGDYEDVCSFRGVWVEEGADASQECKAAGSDAMVAMTDEAIDATEGMCQLTEPGDTSTYFPGGHEEEEGSGESLGGKKMCWQSTSDKATVEALRYNCYKAQDMACIRLLDPEVDKISWEASGAVLSVLGVLCVAVGAGLAVLGSPLCASTGCCR